MEGTQTPLSGNETLLIGLVVFVVVVLSATWELVKHFHVMAHEGMHAMVGSLWGGKVESVELKDNADGETIVVMPRGCGLVAFRFAGYLGSSLFGLGAARLIHFGHIVAVLWIALLLLGLLLITLKRSFGYVTVPLAGFFIFLVMKHMSQADGILAAYVITWFLLLSGVRMIVEHGINAADSGLLKNDTSIPRVVWLMLWLVGTLAAVIIGARWMVHPAVLPPTIGGGT
ncbi:MAG: M50 family metallopeptidase [Streptosporangiaceae bacterium]|nr:M50 family metallopeptidase [Streptosporangiaceae bacterium]